MAATCLASLHLASLLLQHLARISPPLQTKRETGEKSINDISEGRKEEGRKEGKGPSSQGTSAPPLPELEMEDLHGIRLDSGQGTSFIL